MNSTLTIEFLVDLAIDAQLRITINTSGVSSTNIWTWVATRSAGFEVTTGTPTGTAGEISASDFETAYDLDLPTYTTTVTSNEIEIVAPDTTITFTGMSISDADGNTLVNGTDYNVTFANYVAPIDTSNIDLALVRSPHYINIPFAFSTTTSITADIYIWDGDLTAIPATADYTLTIPRPTTDFDEFNVNISNYIESELEPTPNIDVSISPQIVNSNTLDVNWIYYDVTYTDAVESIANITGTFSGTEGYGLYSEGVNPTKPANDWLSECLNRRVSRDGIIILPFVNNGNITSITVQSNGSEINSTLTPTTSNESTEFIQYVEVDVSDATTDDYITISDGTTSFIFEILDECRYNPKQVIFKNRFGVFDSITLFKKSTTTINVEKEQFVNAYLSAGVYDVTNPQIKDINITAKQSITLNSGFLNELENELYKQLLTSDQVWFYESGNLVPVRPSKNSLQLKTRVNDGLVNYEMEFEYAYNYIQNV